MCYNHKKNLHYPGFLLLALIFLFKANLLFAQGALGGELSYVHVIGSKYNVILNFYIVGNTSINHAIVVSDGQNSKVYSITQASSNCYSPAATTGVCSFCNNPKCKNPPPSTNIVTYVCPVDMSYFPGCNITISWNYCCYPGTITTINNPQQMYLECKLNRCNGDHDSPVFQQIPPFWVNYNHNVDVFQNASTSGKNDSLVYRLVQPLWAQNLPYGYLPGYSYLNPLLYLGKNIIDSLPSGFHFDANSSELAFKPAQGDVSIMATEADDYAKDKNGNYYLSGSTLRNFVFTCYGFNTASYNPVIKDINGSGYDTIATCANIPIGFTIKSLSSNPKDTIAFTTTINESGGKVSYSNVPIPIASFYWLPTNADVRKKPYRLVLTARDNLKPSSDVISKTFLIYVTDSLPVSKIVHADSGCARYYFMPPKDTARNLAYKWFVNNKLISTKKSIVYTIPHNGKSIVDLLISDKQGCQKHYYDTLNINILPIITVNKPVEICKGDPATLTVKGANNYTWYPASGLSSDTGASTIASPPVTSTFFVKSADKKGCYSIDSTTVIVDNFQIPINTDTGVCFGNTIKLNAFIPKAQSYKWTNKLGNLLSNTSILSLKITMDTVYFLTIKDSFGCIRTIAGIIRIDKPVAHAGPDISVCYGDSVQLQASGGVSYFWTSSIGIAENNIPNPYVKPAHSQNYVVTVTDKSGCKLSDTVKVFVSSISPGVSNAYTLCKGDSEQLYAYGGVNYTWSPAIGLSNPNIANPFARPDKSTLYTIKICDSLCGCVGKAYALVNISSATAFAGPDRAICMGFTTTIGADSVHGYQYDWTSKPAGFHSQDSKILVSPGVTTTYYLKATNSLIGCTSRDTAIVTVNTVNGSITGPQKICTGDTAMFQTSAYEAKNKYNWTFDGADVVFSAKNYIYLNWPKSGDYQVILVENNPATGCRDSVTSVIKILPYLVSHISSPKNICLGAPISFLDSGASPLSYKWTFGDNSGDTASHPTHLYKNAGTYHITLATSNGTCTTHDSESVHVHQPVILSPDITKTGFRQYQFLNADSTGIKNPQWNTGDTNLVKYNKLVHVYKNNGDYAILFTYIDQWGCSGRFDTSIHVKDSIILPPPHYRDTVFISPNPFSDHIDVHFGLSKQTSIQIMLFDAFGRKVYTNEIDNQAAGNYIFTIHSLPPYLSPGMYLLNYTTWDLIKVFKMVKGE